MKESQVSRDLYELNAKRIRYESDAIKLREKKINIDKIKRIGKYISKGSYQYIIDRIKHISISEDNLNEFFLRDYEYNNKRIVVYMALFGSYDNIYEPLYVNNNIDYIIFTDQHLPENSSWKKCESDLSGKKFSDRDKNRYYKMLPHRFFADYDYSIYIDSSYQIVTDMYPLAMDLGDKDIGIHKFPSESFYSQLETIWSLNRASKESIKADIIKYRRMNVPDNIGYFWNAVLVRKHNSQKCITTMENWWEEYQKSQSKRDQVTLPYCLWQNGYNLDDVVSLGSDIYKNPRFYYKGHLYDDYK